MSLGEVGDRIRHAAERLPVAALVEAGEHLDEAVTIFFRSTEGSTDPETELVLAWWKQAREGIDELVYACDAARQAAHSLADQLGTSATVQPSDVAVAQPQRTHTSNATRGELTDPNSPYQALRRTLEPPIDRAATRGMWIGEHGIPEELSSGEHGPGWREAVAFAQRAGLVRPGGVPTFARHAEIKFAARMRHDVENGLAHRARETIVIDRPPCGAEAAMRRSCDELLPLFLPPGTELTIIERNGKTYTYRGACEQ